MQCYSQNISLVKFYATSIVKHTMANNIEAKFKELQRNNEIMKVKNLKNQMCKAFLKHSYVVTRVRIIMLIGKLKVFSHLKKRRGREIICKYSRFRQACHHKVRVHPRRMYYRGCTPSISSKKESSAVAVWRAR